MTDVYSLAGLHHLLHTDLTSFNLTGVDLTSLADRWAIGGLLTLFFAALARRVRGVTNAGAVAGAVRTDEHQPRREEGCGRWS